MKHFSTDKEKILFPYYLAELNVTYFSSNFETTASIDGENIIIVPYRK